MKPTSTGRRSVFRRDRRSVFLAWIGVTIVLATVPGISPGQIGGGGNIDPVTGAVKPPPFPDPQRLGVSVMAPLYKPNGVLGPTILADAAADAFSLGFRTIKFEMSSQVVEPGWQFYSLPDAEIVPITSTLGIATLPVFQQVLEMPFQTYFITADAIGIGSWDALASQATPTNAHPADVPLSAAAQQQMYQQLYDLAFYLLTNYQGTGKIFVLQNHELDWHVVSGFDPSVNPSDIALANALKYLQLRQQAVNDARLKAGFHGVYVYHLAEVALLKKAMAGGKTVTNNVLPGVTVDLVGYSSWDLIHFDDNQFVNAVNFLKTKANPSFAFGSNNVAITEIGVPEIEWPGSPGEFRHLLEAMALGCPWMVHWTMYCNDCSQLVNGQKVRVFNPTANQCVGTWVRRPNGTFGTYFQAYQPYLSGSPINPEPTDSAAYITEMYGLLMGRAPDPGGLANAVAMIDAAPWNKELLIAELVTSAEYQQRTGNVSAAVVFDAYRSILGRNPEPAIVGQFGVDFGVDNARVGLISQLIGSVEAQGRYINWLYRRYLGRGPTPQETNQWLALFSAGWTRQQVWLKFVRG